MKQKLNKNLYGSKTDTVELKEDNNNNNDDNNNNNKKKPLITASEVTGDVSKWVIYDLLLPFRRNDNSPLPEMLGASAEVGNYPSYYNTNTNNTNNTNHTNHTSHTNTNNTNTNNTNTNNNNTNTNHTNTNNNNTNTNTNTIAGAIAGFGGKIVSVLIDKVENKKSASKESAKEKKLSTQ